MVFGAALGSRVILPFRSFDTPISFERANESPVTVSVEVQNRGSSDMARTDAASNSQVPASRPASSAGSAAGAAGPRVSTAAAARVAFAQFVMGTHSVGG